MKYFALVLLLFISVQLIGVIAPSTPSENQEFSTTTGNFEYFYSSIFHCNRLNQI